MPANPLPSRHESRFTRTLNRLLVKLKVDEVPHIKRIIVTVVGGTVLIFGLILIVTPGPAVLVIPVGLAILGTEYAWARRWLRKARKMASKALSRTQKIMGVGASNASNRQQAQEQRRDEAAAAKVSASAAGHMPLPRAECADGPPEAEELAGSSSSKRDHSAVPRC
jgi:uncharacterized protein (TIGR02611 family)